MSEIDTLARTLWGEARGEGKIGMIAVACVILNRVKLSGKRRDFGKGTISSACLYPWQFSCWNKNDPNLEKLKTVNDSDPAFIVAGDVAKMAVEGSLKDITNGATHYYSSSMKNPPYWAVGVEPCKVIGRHIFFKGV